MKTFNIFSVHHKISVSIAIMITLMSMVPVGDSTAAFHNPNPHGIALDVAGGKMYWTDDSGNKIQRANLNGSNIETLIAHGLDDPYGIALDVAGGKMYWADEGANRIQRANLNGSNIETLVSHGLDDPHGIALDVAGGKMYWTDDGADRIQRANLDGSNVETLVRRTRINFWGIRTGYGDPYGIALDVAGGKMYWADEGENEILRANLDGSNIETLVSHGLDDPHGIALDVAGGKMYWTDDSADRIQRANLDGSNVETLVRRTRINFWGIRTGYGDPYGIALDVAGGKMYWADEGENEILRANLDGSNIEILITLGEPVSPVVSPPVVSPEPKALVFDPESPPIYWTDTGTGKIQHVNLDGSKVEDLVTQGLGIPSSIALDVADGKMYWTDTDTDKIQRANLDGSNIEDLVTQGLRSPYDIALDVADGKMYWADNITDKIQRANLDGSNIEDLVTQGLSAPRSITLDVIGGKMYWTDTGTSKIQRANLDGSNIEDLITQGLSAPRSITLDVIGGKMYWTDTGTDKIQRANLAGSEVEDLVTQGLSAPRSITLDVIGGKMYWTDTGTGKIQRANLDGSEVEDLVTQGLESPSGIAISIFSPVNPTIVKEDVNGDGIVNIQDLVLVASNFGKTGQNAADVNGDGTVNIADLVLVAGALGNNAAAPSWHPQALETLTATEVKQWLSQAQQLDLTDTTSQRGILFLQQLLVALTPKKTALLPNYPNPFNPETWIPYDLAEPGDVTLTIYAANRHVVRQLALGHQRAGLYQSRSRAAYWDGRNAVGEPVASGLYFYTLTAGDFTATRKMLIRK